MPWWSSVVSSVAFAIAIAVATYSWPRMRLASVVVMAWCAAAWALSHRGFFHDARGWHAADIPGFLLFCTLMTLPLVAIALGWYGSRAFRGFVGLLALQPAPVRIGLHPLALISLFQLPLSIVIHLLALRRLMSLG